MKTTARPEKAKTYPPRPALRPIQFGTDGWRGVIAETFTVDNLRLVAHAVGMAYDSGKKPAQKVFVGYDHRFRADYFAKEAARVLALYSFKPYVLPHPVTSPFLSFATWKSKAPFGVMITASHNPPEYLGLKVKGSFGGSIPTEAVKKIEENLRKIAQDFDTAQFMRRPALEPDRDPSKNVAASPLPDYADYLEKNLDFSVLRKPARPFTLDSMFGPGGPIAESVFGKIRPKAAPRILHNVRDPLFGGGRPEPIEECLGDLKAQVLSSKSVAGYALDGDGDRLGVVDEKGRYLTPQQVCALLLNYLASSKKMTGKVVQTVSMGYLTERIAKEFNLPFEEVPVGFKHVAARMLAGEVLLGAEESGGYAFSRTRPKTPRGSVLPERDGLFSALLFQEMVAASGKKPSELLAEVEKRFGVSAYLRNDIRLEKPVEDKAEFIRKIQSQASEKHFGLKIREMRTADGLKIALEDGSWLLIRPSGTEPLIRAYAEFPNMDLTKKSLAKLCELLYNVQNK